MFETIYPALGILTAALLTLLGACWVAVRGLGGMSTLRMQHNELKAGLERIDERITREVKTRAGNARAEIAADERDILQQSQELLAQDGNSTPAQGRPSRMIRRR